MTTDSGEDVQPPSLTGARVSLAPLVPEFIRPIYRLSISENINFRWRLHGAIPPFEAFERSLYGNILVQFAMVLTRNPRVLVGHVVAYDGNLQDGTAYLGVIRDPRLGAGALEGVALFINYVFSHFPLRKLYVQAPEFNLPQFASAITAGLFVEEGCLKDHQYFDDRYWDMHILALYRENHRAFKDRFGRLFRGAPVSTDEVDEQIERETHATENGN